MTAALGFPAVPTLLSDEREHRRQLAQGINRQNQGKFNAYIDVTLRASQLTTTLTDPRIFDSSWLGFMGLTVNGMAAVQRGIYPTALVKGSCTLNHQSSPQTDQTIRVLIIG